MIKKTAIFFMALIFLFIIPAALITFNGLRVVKGKSDIAVVLGTTVYPDGTMSSFLKGRVGEAARLYKAGNFPLIMVSGGTGVEGHDEAEVMGSLSC